MDEIEATFPAAAGARSTLETAHPTSVGVFVGRERELGDMRAALDAVCGGAGRLIMLVGEAGIGKSRIAAELAREARTRGCKILLGRCHEDRGAPAHWPWIQIIRSYAEDRDPTALLAELGPHAADIAHIVPSLRDRLGDLPTPALLPPEQARFRAFDSIAVLFRRLALEQPLVILVEDLQWVDQASLMLLAFLVHQLAESSILILVTQREDEVEKTHPLAVAAAELARSPGSLRIELRGLTRAEVMRYIGATQGVSSNDQLVESVYRASDGNPLFLTEILRLLITKRAAGASGDDLSACGIPSTVRTVIRTRLDRLSRDCKELLGIAAVIGRQFDLGLLARVSELEGPPLIGRIDEALTAKVLAEVQERPGRFRFSHALVRDTLYDELSTGRRLALHRRIGEALEEQYAVCPEPHLAELAYHFFRSAPAGDSAKAVSYALRAAAHSATTLAHEEAAFHYERALRLIEQAGGDERRCCELQLLASESHLRAGDSSRAEIGFRTVTQAAGRIRDAELFSRAALGVAGQVTALGAADPRIVRMLEQARRMLPEEDGALRAQILSRLATETFFSGDDERSLALTQDAVAMARRLGDLHTLAFALSAKRDQQWRGEDLATRLDEAGVLLRLAIDARDDGVALRAYHWRILDLLELGEIAALETELQSFGDLAQELRDPLALYRVAGLRATFALLQGRFDDVERHGSELLARGRSVSPSNSVTAFEGQRALVHWVRGEMDDVLAMAQRSTASFLGLGPWRAVIPGVLADLGRVEEARRDLESMVGPGLATIPKNLFRAPTLALLGYASWRLGEREHATRIYPLLAPYGGRNLVIGFGALAHGAVDYFLGVTAMAMGCFDPAARHFEAAIELDSRMRARPFLAEARYGYATMLLARGRAEDRERVRALLADAHGVALELGMTGLVGRAARLLSDGAIPVAAADECKHVEREPDQARLNAGGWLFRNEGEYWSIGEPARTLRLRDTVGLRYLLHLLRYPGRALLALDVACAARGNGHATVPAAPSSDASVAGTTLRSYRFRLRELRDQLDTRRSLGDARSAAHTESEIEQVAAELSRAIGLGGRVRPLSVSASERARQNVTRAIRKAIQRIAANDRRVGRYLANNVRTGTFCSYEPPPDLAVTWVF